MMKRLLVVFCLLWGWSGTTQAEDVDVSNLMDTEAMERVQSLVLKVVDYYNIHGGQATFDKLNGGWTLDGEDFVFVTSVSEDKMVAHAANRAVVGSRSSEYVNTEGRNIGMEMMNTDAARGAWIRYKVSNPVSRAIESKWVWFVRVGNYIFASGYYI